MLKLTDMPIPWAVHNKLSMPSRFRDRQKAKMQSMEEQLAAATQALAVLTVQQQQLEARNAILEQLASFTAEPPMPLAWDALVRPGTTWCCMRPGGNHHVNSQAILLHASDVSMPGNHACWRRLLSSSWSACPQVPMTRPYVLTVHVTCEHPFVSV